MNTSQEIANSQEQQNQSQHNQSSNGEQQQEEIGQDNRWAEDQQDIINLEHNDNQQRFADTAQGSPSKEQFQDMKMRKTNSQTQEEFFSPSSQQRKTQATENDVYSAQKNSIKSTKSQNRYSGKDFISSNKQVKTFRELQLESNDKQKTRLFSNSSTRQMSQMVQLRKNLPNKDSFGRNSDWHQVNLCNQLLSRERPSRTAAKNYSRDFVIKHIELDVEDLKAKGIPTNNFGGTFSKSRKEKAYHLTNSSSIPNLRSYHALDGPEAVECKEFPTTKGNQQLKRALNKSSVFNHKNQYVKDEKVPEGFEKYRDRPQIIHNVNNNHVQNQRIKNYYSKLF